MLSRKIVKIGVVISHSVIVLGVGHGIGLMGVIDIACIPNLIDDYGLTLKGDLGDSVMTIGLFSLLGKLLFGISFFVKKIAAREGLEFLGFLLLWISFYLLNFKAEDSISTTIIITGIPFILCSIILAFMMMFGDFEIHKKEL